MKVGEFDVQQVIDGSISVPLPLMYPNLTEEDWLPHKDLLNADGTIELATGGFLVRGNGTVALVDVGAGEISVEALADFGGRFLESLAALGVAPADVTDVIFSHLHFDHIGWASKDGAPVFPNATYRCHAKDWDYFMTEATPQPPMTEMAGLPSDTGHWMGPVADRMEMWDGDAAIAPGIDVRDAPGHTHGSSLVVISSGADRAVLLGDAVHCPAELLEAEWEGIADVDPALAKRTREALAREFEGTDVPMSAPHFPGLRFGRLLPAQGRLSWVFD